MIARASSPRMASRILCQSSQQHGDGTLGFLTSWSISCPAENENNENNTFRRGSAALRPAALVRGCMEAVLVATHTDKYSLTPNISSFQPSKLLHSKAESLVCGHVRLKGKVFSGMSSSCESQHLQHSFPGTHSAVWWGSGNFKSPSVCFVYMKLIENTKKWASKGCLYLSAHTNCMLHCSFLVKNISANYNILLLRE